MIRMLLASTALFGIVFFNLSADAATNHPKPTMETPQLKISGQTSFNSLFFDNKRKTREGSAARRACDKRRFARTNLFTADSSRIKFNVDGKTDPGMDYGLVIVLDGNPDATKNVREDYLYFGGTWGRIYAGDTFGVQNSMAFGGYDQWGGTGFLDGGVLDRVVNYTTGAPHSVDLVGDTSRDTKLTYYTPRWRGIQAGVSYTPRTEHRGEQGVNSWTSQKSPKEPFDTESIASGVNFIHKFTCGFLNGLEMALSGTSVFGKAHPEFHGAPKRRKTAGFAFGGTFTYEDIGFSAEYGNDLKSREIKGQSKSNAGQFVDFGLSYTWGATKFSSGYFYGWRKALGGGINSNYVRRKAKTNAVAAAVDHKLAPGLGVYVEYAYIQMKNPAASAKANRRNNILSNCGQFEGVTRGNHANTFILGSRLVF